jgi:hypothetical protein
VEPAAGQAAGACGPGEAAWEVQDQDRTPEQIAAAAQHMASRAALEEQAMPLMLDAMWAVRRALFSEVPGLLVSIVLAKG